ncbi:MAG: histidine kinase [Bacteroidia bacterium]|nr:histidine kinase [Bacteroidia bacterium]
MKQARWPWYVVLVLFYSVLALWGLSFYQEIQRVRDFDLVPGLESSFEGNDWVDWKDTEQGVVAERVHPLPGYKEISFSSIAPGDRILELNHDKVYKAEEVNKITSSRRPGHLFTMKILKYDPFNRIYIGEREIYVQNGFRLSFSFNSMGWYWHLSVWLAGIGAFIALVILIILAPIVKDQILQQLALLALIGTGLLFFLLQLTHNSYLIIKNDLENIQTEQLFILFYLGLLIVYTLCYFFLKIDKGRWTILFLLPSLLAGIFLFFMSYQFLVVEQNFRFFHNVVENSTFIFFLLHLLGGTLLYLSSGIGEGKRREPIYLLLVSLFALGALLFFYFLKDSTAYRDHGIFATFILMFFPLIHSPIQQLQFGKVSLVVTQTLQYLVFLIFGLIIFLLLSQLFSYSALSAYRTILLPVAFLILLAIMRVTYLANEDKLSRYFVSSQQEQLNKIKAFIARIPQYSAAEKLLLDLKKELTDFFQTDNVDLWNPPTELEEGEEAVEKEIDWDRVYHKLKNTNSIWSKTKVISPLLLEDEEELSASPYHLISPISIEEGDYLLLKLGKKKRGVYNLSDLELISQIVQQTQLTLNVLVLNQREVELVQQTYDAKLTALRSQINPHFLFNTLNSIGELVHESADRAEAAVEKLAYIFRYTLDKSSENFVALDEEVSLIRTYLEMEKIRFGEKLDIDIEIRDNMNKVPIPSFILLTLVENCIKHGVSKILHNGWVSVMGYQEDDFLVCEVEDNGPGIDVSRIYKSHGLSNSISRIENIYEMKDLFNFQNTGNGTLVTLKIPLSKAYEKAGTS